MADLEEEHSKSTNKNSSSFINHVFNFDDDSKSEMSNIMQYGILSVIPIVLLNKTIQQVIPEPEENKPSLEILFEIILQIIIMFIGILLIHRIITFIPTYSEVKYETFYVTNIILAFLVIVLSLQTKLGEKVNILTDRLIEVVNGNSYRENMENPKKNNASNNNNNIRVSQPLNLDNANLNQQMPTTLPQPPQMSNPTQNMDIGMQMGGIDMQQIPQEQMPPMAANELGGGFGSAF